MNLGLLRNLTAMASGALARIEKQDLGRRDRSSSRSRRNLCTLLFVQEQGCRALRFC
jgi:hypothetical protein